MGDIAATVGVSIETVNNTAPGMKAAADGVKQGTEEIKNAVGGASAEAEKSATVFDRFSGVLKEHKKEHGAAAKQTKFFTKEIAELTGKGSESSIVLGRLAGGLASGGAFGLGIAAATAGAHLLKSKLSELTEQMVGPFSAAVDKGVAKLKELEDANKNLAKEIENTEQQARLFGLTATQQSIAMASLAKINQENAIASNEGQIASTEKLVAAQKKQLEDMKNWTNMAGDYAKALVNPFGAVADAVERKAMVESLEKEISLNEQEISRNKTARERVALLDKQLDALHNLAVEEAKPKAAKGGEDELSKQIAIETRAQAFMEEVLAKQAAEKEKKRAAELAAVERHNATVLSIEQRRLTALSELEDHQRMMREERERVSDEKILAEKQRAASLQISILNSVGNASSALVVALINDQKNAGKAAIKTIIRVCRDAVMAYAAQAAAAAMAANSGIPVVGIAVGMAAAGMAFAAAEAFADKIPSARFGYDIPSGINPLTQLHEREMVLPARIADPLRDALAGGSGMLQAPNIYISGIDGPSIMKLVESPAFSAAIQENMRNGR